MTFFAFYEGVVQVGGFGERYYFFKKSEPGYPPKPNLPECITQISPDFGKIYYQAQVAEEKGLLEICGSGYRKALEFLIKDFAGVIEDISDDDRAQIPSLPLGVCIKRFIADSRTKEIAQRAAWLGNDETHYYRKWSDKDLSDLKVLLRLTINFIDNSLTADKYISEMKKD